MDYEVYLCGYRWELFQYIKILHIFANSFEVLSIAEKAQC